MNEDQMLHTNKKYKIFLENEYKYEGSIISETTEYIKIHDERTNLDVIIMKKNITIIHEVKWTK